MNRYLIGLFFVGLAFVTVNRAPAVEPGAMPAAGKADTIEQDQYLRRVKYPLQIKVIETDGKGGENVPLTLSVACGEGDYPAGKLCPMLAGQPVPAQVDVLATWPSDRSIKHALVSLVLPKIGPKETLVFTFSATVPIAAAKFVPAVDLKGLAFKTEFENKDGAKTVSAIDAATLAKFAAVLDGKVAGEQAKNIAPRLCGPVCYEFEVKVPAKTGAAADKDIDVYYRLRVYSGLKAVRVEYDVENSRLPAKPYPKDLTITDRPFAKLTFQAGPADKVQTVYEQGPVTQWFGTRYRVCQWSGERPLPLYTKESVAYLTYSEFFPKLDLDHSLTDKQVEALAGGTAKRRVGSIVDYYKDHETCPDGSPLSNGPVTAFMGMTGGRWDIGALPYWYRLALASESPVLEHFARVADGNGLAAFPVHMRPAENGQPGIAYNDPIRDLLYSGKLTHVKVDAKGCPNGPDAGHVPCTSYYTYLATGEKFYEEEMAFWSASQLWGKEGYFAKHDRYAAWPLRNATDAAFVLPDGHPMKQLLHDYVQRTVEYQAKLVKDPLKYWAANRQAGSSPAYVCSGICAFWQHVFYVWSLDNASRKGFYPVAAEARDAAADLLVRMYEGAEEFKAPDGKTYRSKPESAIPYLMAMDLRRVDFTEPKHITEIFLKTLTDNTGAIYYYTMVNNQHAYLDREAFCSKLTKKVMDPEDWKLDPEFVKKQEADVESKIVHNPGYHEEANGPTSAALARYDNPRAQKMYEFVRGLIERAGGPERLRGVEYVK